jgi:hypothetical protein
MQSKSQAHLADSNMSYKKHCLHSLANGCRLIVLAGSSFVHAFFPGILRQHAARGIIRIYNRMKHHAHLRRAMKEMNND